MANDGKLNNARYQLDFGMIPKIFYKDPVDFTTRCRRAKSDYLCALFNRYYQVVNTVYFFDRPKKFRPSDFSQRETSPAGGKQLLHITLPTEHEGSLEYCTDYVIAFEKGLFGVKNPRLYAIERNLGGVMTIGAMEPDGTHTDHGPAAGTVEENLARIARIAFAKEGKS